MDLNGTISSTVTHSIRGLGVDRNEEIMGRCQLARTLEDEGKYDGAREALGDLWPELDQRPLLDDLSEATQAEVLLHAGTIAGWIGHTRQVEGLQEIAKDLIFESARTFEQL